jgi:hypothetical protein
MTICRNEHGLAERHLRQLPVNDDRPHVHLLEVGLRERIVLVRANASAAIVGMGARIKARIGRLLEKVRVIAD